MRVSCALVALLVAAVSGSAGRASLATANEYGGAVFLGRGGVSVDGLGQDGVGASVQADVPSGSTVEHAWLYGSYTGAVSPMPVIQRTFDFDGSTVVLDELPNAAPGCCNFRSARGDVTGPVAAKVGGGGGITSFTINSAPASFNGVALVVVYSNPLLPLTTIAVLDGSAEHEGETVSFFFAQPVNKLVPGFAATLSLGIGYSYNSDPPVHTCSQAAPFIPPQYTSVDVNGKRLTSCAGNYDDGTFPYHLITVGGVGDSLANPPDPNGAGGEDDELYDIAGYIPDGARAVEVATVDRSSYRDETLFLEVISVTAVAYVGCAENGLDVLEKTPLAGAASRTVHNMVEPVLDGVVPGSGFVAHVLNCLVVVPAEDAVDGVVGAPRV